MLVQKIAFQNNGVGVIHDLWPAFYHYALKFWTPDSKLHEKIKFRNFFNQKAKRKDVKGPSTCSMCTSDFKKFYSFKSFAFFVQGKQDCKQPLHGIRRRASRWRMRGTPDSAP